MDKLIEFIFKCFRSLFIVTDDPLWCSICGIFQKEKNSNTTYFIIDKLCPVHMQLIYYWMANNFCLNGKKFLCGKCYWWIDWFIKFVKFNEIFTWNVCYWSFSLDSYSTNETFKLEPNIAVEISKKSYFKYEKPVCVG